MMMVEAGGRQTAPRTAVSMVVAGVLANLGLAGHRVFHATETGCAFGAVTPQASGAVADRARMASALGLGLLVALALVLLVLFGSLVFVRLARRHSAASGRVRATPTPTDDLWAMPGQPPDADRP